MDSHDSQIIMSGKMTQSALEMSDRWIRSKTYGKSTKSRDLLHNIAYIDEVNRGVFNIGQVLKYELFHDHPPFTITTLFGSGGEPRSFANPKSYWFNAVMGVMRVDMPIGEVDRPFGFTERSEIHRQDIVLICKAIINYITCHVYGVPIEACVRNSSVGGEEVSVLAWSARGVGGNMYTELEIREIECVSGYRAKDDLHLVSPELTGIWQRVLGKQQVSRKMNDPFPSVRMVMRVLIRYEKSYDPVLDCPQYCTYIKFGSAAEPFPYIGKKKRDRDSFLNEQMRVLKEMGTMLPYVCYS